MIAVSHSLCLVRLSNYMFLLIDSWKKISERRVVQYLKNFKYLIAKLNFSLENLGFWILCCGFRIPATGFWIICHWNLPCVFQSLGGFWIPKTKFRIPQAKIFRIPESGRYLFFFFINFLLLLSYMSWYNEPFLANTSQRFFFIV